MEGVRRAGEGDPRPIQEVSVGVKGTRQFHDYVNWEELGKGTFSETGKVQCTKGAPSWEGLVTVCGVYLFSRFNYDPSVSVPPRHYPDAEVDGRNRYQFFRRPIIPFLPQMPPNVVLAPTR